MSLKADFDDYEEKLYLHYSFGMINSEELQINGREKNNSYRQVPSKDDWIKHVLYQGLLRVIISKLNLQFIYSRFCTQGFEVKTELYLCIFFADTSNFISNLENLSRIINFFIFKFIDTIICLILKNSW